MHQGLRETLFERLQQQQASASATLTVQYRMNSHIMRWSSDEFYGGRLTAHSSVAEHTLQSLPVRYLGHNTHEFDPGCHCEQLRIPLIALACFGPVKRRTCQPL